MDLDTKIVLVVCSNAIVSERKETGAKGVSPSFLHRILEIMPKPSKNVIISSQVIDIRVENSLFSSKKEANRCKHTV